MLLKKLIEILKTFDKAELKKFRRFIGSDYFNTNESVGRLFRLISAFHPAFEEAGSRLSPELLFKKIYGTRKYDEKTFRYLLSVLYNLLEKYLAISMFESSELEMKKYTIDEMIERRLFKGASRNLAAAETQLEANPLINGEYIYNKIDFSLLWHQLYFISNMQEPLIEKRVEQGELQLFCSLVELSHIYQILQAVSKSYNIPLENNLVFEYLRSINYKKVLEYIEKAESKGKSALPHERLHKAVQIYLCFLVTMIEESDEEYFERMDRMVSLHSGLFARTELQNLYVMLSTACTKKRKTINEEKYLRIFFGIIKNAVSKDLYTSYRGQYMDVSNFIMIFQTALQLKEYDWAADFLRRYGERISPEYLEDMVGYSFAELFFTKKQFERSLGSLSKVSLKLFRLKVPVKILMLRLYYELNYIEEAFSLVDSFSHFLTSNKKIRTDEKDGYLNFLYYYREIMKAKAEGEHAKFPRKVKEELSAASLLPHKSWLIEKAGEFIKA